MIEKLKNLLSLIEPKILALISMAPFLVGILVGYLLRGPIGLVLDLIKLLLKL